MDPVRLEEWDFVLNTILDLWAVTKSRSIRMAGDTILTGSDDWTARMWSASRGTCDAVLACHAGPILCVEYSMSDKGIFTGLLSPLLMHLLV